MYLLSLSFLCAVSAVFGVPVINRCRLEDANCITASAQQLVPSLVAGIPEIGVEVMDIMNLDDISIDVSGLKFKLTKGKFKGLKGTIIDNVRWNKQDNELFMDFKVNSCSVKGLYVASGQLLVLPLNGDGDIKMKIRDLVVHAQIKFEDVRGSDGVVKFVPKGYKVKAEVLGHAQIQLTNLFNGNKELSEPVLSFINQNWKAVADEFGTPLIEKAAKQLLKNVAKFMKYYSKDQLLLS